MGRERFSARAGRARFLDDVLSELVRIRMLDRDLIVQRLQSDLIGPLSENEVLEDAKPSDVYLTGILWPKRARQDAADDDRLDSAGTAGTEDETQGSGEEVPLAGAQRPC